MITPGDQSLPGIPLKREWNHVLVLFIVQFFVVLVSCVQLFFLAEFVQLLVEFKLLVELFIPVGLQHLVVQLAPAPAPAAGAEPVPDVRLPAVPVPGTKRLAGPLLERVGRAAPG